MDDFLIDGNTSDIVEGVVNVSGLREKARNLPSYRAGMAFNTYYLPFIIAVGYAGNSLSLCVARMRHNLRVPFCIYMGALALTDNAMLTCGLYMWFIGIIKTHRASLLECNILSWAFQWISCCGIYLIVLMTLDRYLAVCHPHKALKWRSAVKAKGTIYTLALLLVLFTVPVGFLSNISSGGFCTGIGRFTGSYKQAFAQFYAFLTAIVVCIVPSTAIITLNTLIIEALKKRKRFLSILSLGHWSTSSDQLGQEERSVATPEAARRDARRSCPRESFAMETRQSCAKESCTTESCTSENPLLERAPTTCFCAQTFVRETKGSVKNHEAKEKKGHKRTNRNSQIRDVQLTAILLLVSFTLLLLTLPQYIRYALYVYIEITESPESLATYVLVYNLTQKLYFTNSACNFYLYCLGSPTYRHDCRKLFTAFKSSVVKLCPRTSSCNSNRAPGGDGGRVRWGTGLSTVT